MCVWVVVVMDEDDALKYVFQVVLYRYIWIGEKRMQTARVVLSVCT